jgi:hypothetical protein
MKQGNAGLIELERERRIRQRLDALADKLKADPEEEARTLEHLESEAENERNESSD